MRDQVTADLHDVGPAALGDPGPELPGVAVAGVGDYHRWGQAPAGQLIEHVDGQPPLLPMPNIVADTGPGAPGPGRRRGLLIVGAGGVPAPREEQPPGQRT